MATERGASERPREAFVTMHRTRSDMNLAIRMGRFSVTCVGLLAAFVSMTAWAAQTQDPAPMSRTTIALKLAVEGKIPFESRSEPQQKEIVIQFPSGRVIGSLPEQSVVDAGAIRQITTEYYRTFGREGQRFIREVRIVLSGDYRHRVWAEAGRVMIEIEHPAIVGSNAFELGLHGGIVISSLGRPVTLARFRAMQAALQQAALDVRPIQREQEKVSTPTITAKPQVSAALPSERKVSRFPRHPSIPIPFALGLLAVSGIVLTVLMAILAWFSWKAAARLNIPESVITRSEALSSSTALIDELVSRSFERQGYNLAGLEEVPDSTTKLRLLEKDGSRIGLWCVGSGTFFEKQTVDRFAELMRSVQVEEGFLAATGSFTVPAQRAARDQHITLIGREQLVGLLGIGAAGEYVQSQLQESKVELDTAKRTLRRYEDELEVLRRQRNEASWHLGSERVKASTHETQLEQLTGQLEQYKAELQKWETETAQLNKQWQESQWYLGESRAREQHIQTQLGVLQASGAQAGILAKERGEMVAAMAQERSMRQTMEAELAGLRLVKSEAERREQELLAGIGRYKQELHAVRFYGERRSAVRAWISDAFIEVSQEEKSVFSGTPLDLSGSGMRVSSPAGIGNDGAFMVRLHLPGLAEPADIQAERVWAQEQGGLSSSGYRFIGLADDVRTHVERLVANGAAGPIA